MCLLQAMDNSIGNMGKQLGALIKAPGQQSANLQQTPTVDAANAFQQVSSATHATHGLLEKRMACCEQCRYMSSCCGFSITAMA